MIARVGLEGGEITWFSNTDVAGVAQSSALEKSKIVWFSNKQGPIFLRTFLLEVFHGVKFLQIQQLTFK